MNSLVSALKNKSKKPISTKDFRDDTPDTSSRGSSSKPSKSAKKKGRVQLPFSNQKNLHGAVRIIDIKAGRNQSKSKRKRKRHKYGPKKGEVVTSTDEEEDEENLNTQTWSASSVDDNDQIDKKVLRPLLATGPSQPNLGVLVDGQSMDPLVYDAKGQVVDVTVNVARLMKDVTNEKAESSATGEFQEVVGNDFENSGVVRETSESLKLDSMRSSSDKGDKGQLFSNDAVSDQATM